ncbi:MAG TPA: hypothetical protein EYP53_10950 [Candidatus Latescibacteria bacterium]|nr:hypothetical protein [Candidatus Latescibacterota bacterium]
MNANDIREHLLSKSPWPDRSHTVDTVKVGEPLREVHSIAVGWMPTIDNLRRAVELGCELFVSHEALFWDWMDPVADQRLRSEEPGMVVLRAHDTWDRWPEIGIRDSWAKGLGFANLVAEDSTHSHAVYAIEQRTLIELARHIAGRVKILGQDSVQVMGDPSMKVSRPSLGAGCAGPNTDMIELGSDVLTVDSRGRGEEQLYPWTRAKADRSRQKGRACNSPLEQSGGSLCHLPVPLV